jgi:hypothetical protein
MELGPALLGGHQRFLRMEETRPEKQDQAGLRGRYGQQ